MKLSFYCILFSIVMYDKSVKMVLYLNFFVVSSYSEDGAMCAMKEVDVIPFDSKSAECIKQLEQVIL